MTQLTEFLLSDGKIPNGNTFGQIMNQHFDVFESSHDQIQWMFPLPEPSKFQPNAPVLTLAEFHELKIGYFHLDRLVSAKRFMLEFLGNYKSWMTMSDHNHLRISRVIKCASLFRGPVYADDFRIMVWRIIRDNGRQHHINNTTIAHWLNAISYGDSEEIRKWKS